MSQVVELSQPAQLDQYALLWKALHQQTRGATIFQTLPWLETYWKHFRGQQRLRILLVISGGDVIGILPLVLKREQTRLGRILVLTYPLDDWGNFFGPLGPNPTATLTAAMQYLSAKRDWDLLDLRWLDPRVDHGRTRLAMQNAGLQGWEGIWKTTALVEFTESWDEYLNSRSSKFRQALRRAEQRARIRGELTFERHRATAIHGAEADRCLDLIEECVEVAKRSWQAESTTGTTLSHASVLDYFRDTHVIAARAGAVDINLLRLNGQAIAFAYNYHHEGSLLGVRMGYDRQFADLSPGTILLARSLEDSFRRRDRCLDLGAESPRLKQRWLTRQVPCLRCSHYRLASLRGQLLRCKRWWSQSPTPFDAPASQAG